jgi:hypothetical protein
MPAGTKPPRYKPHPMLDMERRGKERIEQDTGRSFEAWTKLGRTKGPKDLKALRTWFRKEHGHTSMNAYWLAGAVLTPETDYGDPEPFVDALYSGEKAALRPLHEAVVDVLVGLGDDVTVTSCKTMVPAYRKHVFAELAPTSDGVQVQLSLGEAPFTGRLERALNRMPGDRLSHAVTVRSKKDVDGALKGWLKQAYALGAGKIARSTEFAVPGDFAKGLKKSKPATATWGTMTPAMQRDMVAWVTSAKQADTRARRLATCFEKLASGKKRVY